MQGKITIEGTDEIRRVLSNLSDRVNAAVFFKAFAAGARPVVAAIKSRAPVSPRGSFGNKPASRNHPAGNLKKSIKMIKGRGRRWPTVFIGPSAGAKSRYDAWYATFVVGGIKQAPQPFVEQGWSTSSATAAAAINSVATAEIKKILASYQ